MLLTLGDRAQAAALAADALAAGSLAADELRHPERAAAWLRRRVVDRATYRSHPQAAAELEVLGAGTVLMSALGTLRPVERAALIAASIERLDHRDVGTIVGRAGARLDRLIHRARVRYMDAYAAMAPDAAEGGPLVGRIQELARSSLS